MERYRPTPEEIKQTPEAQKKPAVWRKFSKYAEIAALVALLSTQAFETSAAQEKNEKVDDKAKIEQLKDKAVGHIKEIITALKTKGQSGQFNQVPVRRWLSPEQKTSTTVGYTDKEENSASWVIHEGNDALMRFFDKGADGTLDRIVINDANKKLGINQISAENDLKTFTPIEWLADDASVEADLDPDNVKVYEFSFANEKYVIRSVDFKTGEAAELTGPDAEKLTERWQGVSTSSMEDVEKSISK